VPIGKIALYYAGARAIGLHAHSQDAEWAGKESMFKSILVLESPWNADSVQGMSVWPFVNEFANARELSAFHRKFSDKRSFRHWVDVFSTERVPSPKLLYVAAHGEDNRIGGLKRAINGKTICDTLMKSTDIQHVHFGSCLYGSPGNLDSLMKAAGHIKSAAGYDQYVEWVDSTLFDVMLLGRLVHPRG